MKFVIIDSMMVGDLEQFCNLLLRQSSYLVLYCTGKYEESLKLLRHMPYIDSFTAKKTSEFYKFLR